MNCDFCVSVWEPYVVKKLLEYAHSRRNDVSAMYNSFLWKTEHFHLQGDGTTWEIHLRTRLRVKVVPP